MPIREIGYQLSLQDEATNAFKKFTTTVETGSQGVKESIRGSSSAIDNQGRVVSRLTEYVREQRAEQRMQNFLFREARDVISLAATAVTLYAGATGEANSTIRNVSMAVNTGIIAFQGFNAALGALGVSSGVGLTIAVIGSVALAIQQITASSEEAQKTLNDFFVDANTRKAELEFGLGKKTQAEYLSFLNERKSALESELGTLAFVNENAKKRIELETEILQIQMKIKQVNEQETRKEEQARQREEKEKKQEEERLEKLATTWALTHKVQRASARTVQDTVGWMHAGLADIKFDVIEIGKTIDTEWYDKVRLTTEEFLQLNPVMGPAIQMFADTLHSSVSAAWNDTFGEANSLFEQFAQRMTSYFADELLTTIADTLLDLLPGGSILSSIGDFLGFHQGGIVPKAHSGVYVNAPPSREFLVMVRGGETIRTEKQEAALRRQGGGSTFNINITSYGSGGSSLARVVVDALKHAARETGMPIDQLVANKRSNIVLAS